MRPAESLPRSAAQHGKKELSGRREQLVEAIAAAKERLRRVDHEVVRASVEPQIEALEREVKRIESAIAEALSNDETTRSTAAILESIPGVGKSFKQAMTACMRKLLVLMSTLVARGQVWDPSRAT
jgi:transposase